ncbi:MAG: isopentenyl phosphate kinase [Methanobrevibacter sp.]|nr:isopentenyl phosphate kinase [Methanobrevibacter sp.]
MIILKLGGSILTNKDSNESEVNYTNLNRIAKEIKDAIDILNFTSNQDLNKSESSDLINSLIIIHGAGSYGHPPAKKYKIGEPFTEEEYPKKRIGFSKTQNSVKKLNTIICDALINEGIPCVSMQASSFITTKNKRINSFNLELLEKYLKKGFIPVFYGDVVLDSKLKVAVLSGDQILQYIAKNININKFTSSKKINASKKVILGTDVEGVFTKNPKKYKDAKHIEKLSSLEEIEEFDSTTNIDVTGGMIGKIKELLELAELGIESKIINANEHGAIFNALNNKEVKATIIRK